MLGVVMQEPSGSEEVYPGDVSVFPVGLIRFRSKPHLNPDVLAKSFQLDKNLVIFRNGSGCLRVFVFGIKHSSKLVAVQ
ncbi:hypothetical protein V6N13_014993 [Hibiscus sabdariffa]|uniref:Uncharacterized protein n=1 Tax=Hibiscus sabdariffa TaxID=183260 RepID=A0ABR2RXN9_9ROSI